VCVFTYTYIHIYIQVLRLENCEPISLADVEDNLESQLYSNHKEFLSDIKRIWKNCEVLCPLAHHNTLQHATTRCSTLPHTHNATHCNILHIWKSCEALCPPAHHDTLQHTAASSTLEGESVRNCVVLCPLAHYNLLQHAATPCNTLQHPATHTTTHCNIKAHFEKNLRCCALSHSVAHCKAL